MKTIEDLTAWLGSANVQKIIGLVQAGVAATTGAEGKSLSSHVAMTTIGTAYAAFIHIIDAARAKIEK